MNKTLAKKCITQLNDLLDEIEQLNSGDEYYDADEVRELIKELKKIK